MSTAHGLIFKKLFGMILALTLKLLSNTLLIRLLYASNISSPRFEPETPVGKVVFSTTRVTPASSKVLDKFKNLFEKETRYSTTAFFPAKAAAAAKRRRDPKNGL